jgi:hypothetical protein
LNDATWRDFYNGDLQSLYALVAIPLGFLLYRLVRGRPGPGLMVEAAPFVDGYAIVFAVETILDPIIGGPLMRALGLADSGAATAVMVGFVLLGDFRVYFLLFGLIALGAGRRWSTATGTAIGWTVLVPMVAYAVTSVLHAAVAGLDPNTIWLVYELLFSGVALALRAHLVSTSGPSLRPALRAYLRAVLLYAAAYYGLWAVADGLIQLGGVDAGWLLRMLPNQLYYAFWVPLVFARFFSRSYAATSASAQAAR